jgi:predicted nucleotidyltransferase
MDHPWMVPDRDAQCRLRKAPRMNVLIEQHRDAIRALCWQYGVSHLDLFGSASTRVFDPATSDLNIIATIPDTRSPGYADRYLRFAEALETLFDRSVDVITERSIRNFYFRSSRPRANPPMTNRFHHCSEVMFAHPR